MVLIEVSDVFMSINCSKGTSLVESVFAQGIFINYIVTGLQKKKSFYLSTFNFLVNMAVTKEKNIISNQVSLQNNY